MDMRNEFAAPPHRLPPLFPLEILVVVAHHRVAILGDGGGTLTGAPA